MIKPKVKYVLVPADADAPMQELELDVPSELDANISCLTTLLQGYYRRTAGAFTQAGKEAMMESVRQKMREQQPGSQPDEGMLSRLAESQTVDIVQVLPATRDSDFVGVNLYVDDKGQSRGSPLNARATAICSQCGTATDILGDGFFARVWDDQEGFERQDFTLADLSSDAPWIKLAAERAARRADPHEAAARLQQAGAPPAQCARPELGHEERLEAAAAERAAGAAGFKAGEHAEAAARFEAALALFAPRPADFPAEGEAVARMAELQLACNLNLAACRLRLEQPYPAIEACDRALGLDEQSAKAWYRRGQACLKLGQHEAARKNLTRACQLAPGSREIREELEKCKRPAAGAKFL